MQIEYLTILECIQLSLFDAFCICICDSCMKWQFCIFAMILSDNVGSCCMVPKKAGQFWWKTYDWNITHEIQLFHHFFLWNVGACFNLILRATFGFSNRPNQIWPTGRSPHVDCKIPYIMASHPTNHLGRQLIALSQRLLHIPGVDRVISEASTVRHMSKVQGRGPTRTFFNRKPKLLVPRHATSFCLWFSADIFSESMRLLQTSRCLPNHNLFTLPKSLILFLRPRALPNIYQNMYIYTHIFSRKV